MDTGTKAPLGVKLIIGFFVLSVVLWVIGQGGALVAYDQAASMGFHVARDNADPIHVQVTQGIAFADMIIHFPFFLIAVLGLWQLRFYGVVASWFAFAIDLYWPTVAWAKQTLHVQAGNLQPFPLSLHLALAFIFLFSCWASWYLFKNRTLFD